MDSGYDVTYLSHALADLPVVLLGRLRSDRVMLRDPGPARSAPRGGRPRRHGGVLAFAKPETWHEPRGDHVHGHHPLRHGRDDGLGPDAPPAHPPRPLAGPRKR